MKTIQFASLLFVTVALSACGDRSDPDAAAPGPAAETSQAPTTAATPAAVPVEALVKNVVADGVTFQPEAASIQGDVLASTGATGYMMFGPYVAFVPGVYRVTVQGTINSLDAGASIKFDAVSAAATSVHGEQVVATADPSSDTIGEFEVTIPDGVSDLEIRAYVTDGADVQIRSYQITAAD